MKRLRIMIDKIPADLALVIALTLACTHFVLTPQLHSACKRPDHRKSPR